MRRRRRRNDDDDDDDHTYVARMCRPLRKTYRMCCKGVPHMLQGCATPPALREGKFLWRRRRRNDDDDDDDDDEHS